MSRGFWCTSEISRLICAFIFGESPPETETRGGGLFDPDHRPPPPPWGEGGPAQQLAFFQPPIPPIKHDEGTHRNFGGLEMNFVRSNNDGVEGFFSLVNFRKSISPWLSVFFRFRLFLSFLLFVIGAKK